MDGRNGDKGVTWQQEDLFDLASEFGCRVSVSSGHGTGKTRAFGVISLWHLLCYRDSNTYLTAPKLKTVREGVWKEMSALLDSMRRGPYAWLVDYIEPGAEKFYIKGHSKTWFVTTRTAPRGSPENLAGTHNNFLLWLADEASGIPDANFGVIGGALTDERNRFVIASQPTRSSGFFRETHHSLSKRQGGAWDTLTFNSEESPLVSDKFLREKLKQYGGRDSVEYQIKVRGLFPTDSDEFLVSRTALERALHIPSPLDPVEPYGHLVIVDVSAAQHRDRTVAVHMKVQGNGDRLSPEPRRAEVMAVPVYSNALDWTPAARMIADYVLALSNCVVLVDCHGMGSQFARRLEEFGVRNIVEVTWGNPPFNAEYEKRFYDQRAQCTVHLKEAIEDGRIKLLKRYEKDLLDQGSRIPFTFDEHGRWRIAKKADMAKAGLPSPDYFDCLAMGFLEDAIYIPARDDSQPAAGRVSRREKARERARAAMS